MKSPFIKNKPFVSFRVYMIVEEGYDTDELKQYNFEWGKEFGLWYLENDKYIASPISKSEELKMQFQPFKAIGNHQYFLYYSFVFCNYNKYNSVFDYICLFVCLFFIVYRLFLWFL